MSTMDYLTMRIMNALQSVLVLLARCFGFTARGFTVGFILITLISSGRPVQVFPQQTN